MPGAVDDPSAADHEVQHGRSQPHRPCAGQADLRRLDSAGRRGHDRTMVTHPAYQAVAPDDFDAMVEPTRYARRSSDFDEIIARTDEHFWNPDDRDYIDYGAPRPDATIMPEWLRDGERNGGVGQARRPTSAAPSSTRARAGACRTSCTASRARSTCRPASATSSATRARRNTPPTRRARRPATSRPSPRTSRRAGGRRSRSATRSARCWPRSSRAPEVYKKIVGMQMLVEGLAMGAFATLLPEVATTRCCRQLCQLVMTDEAFHHKFGKIWADRTMPKLPAEEHDIVEDWAAHCFQTLLFNLVEPVAEAARSTPQFGLDLAVRARRGHGGAHRRRPPRGA